MSPCFGLQLCQHLKLLSPMKRGPVCSVLPLTLKQLFVGLVTNTLRNCTGFKPAVCCTRLVWTGVSCSGRFPMPAELMLQAWKSCAELYRLRMVCYWGAFMLIVVGSLFFPFPHTDKCFLLTKSCFYPKYTTVFARHQGN